MDYLSLPLTLRKGFFRTTDLYESINHSIGLILSTRRGSLPFDAEFGCDLWEKEYSDLFMANRAEVQGSVRNAINRYEQRLFNVSVTLVKVETSPDHPLGLAVKIVGNYKDDEGEKRFEETFNVG